MCSNKSEVSPATPPKSNFSLSVLKKLLTLENSCVSRVTCQRSIDITPLHLANFKSSIRDLLDAQVNKYDVELQGVILAHKNVKIVAESIVLSDNRYFPVEYVSDIYIFKPQIGSKLTGVVNKIPSNREYISVLVHNIFNVVVYAAQKQPKPAFKIGSSVNVTVTFIDFTGRLPYIRAEISSEELNGLEEIDGMNQGMTPPQLLKTPLRKGLTSILKNSPARVAASSTDVETESSSAENGIVNQGAGSSNDEVKKKKKKKKDKEKKDLGDTEAHVMKSPSRKRKRPQEEDGEAQSPSKKKKKKKKHSDQDRENESLTEGNDNDPMNTIVINAFDNSAHNLNDASIMNAASSTPVLGPPTSPEKKKSKSAKTRIPDYFSLMQQTVSSVKSELKTADSGISSSDEKKSEKSVKVKKEPFSSQSSSKGESVDEGSSKDSSKKKKKKKREKIKTETVDDITQRLLDEAMEGLKTEK